MIFANAAYRGFLRHGLAVALLVSTAAMAATPFTLYLGASGDLTIALEPNPEFHFPWTAGETYQPYTVVSHRPDGTTPRYYVSTVAHANHEPGVAPDWTSFWRPTEHAMSYLLGFRADARDGIDILYPNNTIDPFHYDQIRPFPSIGGPSLFFPAPDPYSSLSQDIRPPAQVAVWELFLTGMTPGASVTLEWALSAEGGLDGQPLSLMDAATGDVLVPDMTAATSLELRDADRALVVVYGSDNRPPVASGDDASMLLSDGTLVLPVADLLANDYDIDEEDTLTVVAVSAPGADAEAGGKGVSAYGTTTLAGDAITYTLPADLPAEWNGVVYFTYTIRDSHPTDPKEASAAVRVAVSSTLLVTPSPSAVAAVPGSPVRVSYLLSWSPPLQSLALDITLPPATSYDDPVLWGYGGDYGDDDAVTADPVISVVGNRLRLDFGSAVPVSGTRLSFLLNAPDPAAAAVLRMQALYRIDAGEIDPQVQAMPPLYLRGTYPVTFLSAGNGAVTGNTLQNLAPGQLSTPVSAVPADDYTFRRWTVNGAEISRDNPLVVQGGEEAATVVAEFAYAYDPAAPQGPFDLIVRDSALASQNQLWDLTGHYRTTLASGQVLILNLLHDERGTLRGTGRLQGTVGTRAVDVYLSAVTGSVSAKAGRLTAKLALRGNLSGTSVSLQLTLTRSGLALVGSAIGSMNDRLAGRVAIQSACALALPTGMDGSYSLPVDLALTEATGAITGTAALILSNGRRVDLVVQGRRNAPLAMLELRGDTAVSPSFGPVECRLTVEPYSGGTAAIRALAMSAFGQNLTWP